MYIKIEQHNEDMARLRAEHKKEIAKLKSECNEIISKHESFIKQYLYGDWDMARIK